MKLKASLPPAQTKSKRANNVETSTTRVSFFFRITARFPPVLLQTSFSTIDTSDNCNRTRCHTKHTEQLDHLSQSNSCCPQWRHEDTKSLEAASGESKINLITQRGTRHFVQYLYGIHCCLLGKFQIHDENRNIRCGNTNRGVWGVRSTSGTTFATAFPAPVLVRIIFKGAARPRRSFL